MHAENEIVKAIKYNRNNLTLQENGLKILFGSVVMMVDTVINQKLATIYTILIEYYMI